MKRKIVFVGLVFLFLFVIYSFSTVSSALSFEAEGSTFDFGDIDDRLLEYTIVCYGSFGDDGSLRALYIYTSDTEPVVERYSSSNPELGVMFNNGCLLIRKYLGRSVDFIELTGRSSCGTIEELKGDYKVVYNNFDIKDKEGNTFFDKVITSVTNKFELNLTVTPTEKTENVPVVITSQWYRLDKINSSLKIFTDNQLNDEFLYIPVVDNPLPVEGRFGKIEVNKDNEGNNIYRYVYNVYKNGTYEFRLFNHGNLEDVIYKTIVIDNIVPRQDTVNNYVNGVFDPTPFLAYEYVSDSEIYITTQKFFINELIDLQCFWAKDIDIKADFNNSDKWTKVENPRSFHDELSQQDVYQFYFSVKNDNFDADGTYYVKFYNVFLDKWTWSSINICFEDILKVDGSLLFKYVSFFRERFGFLVYPFDLSINILNKIKNVNFVEPAFSVPDIYEPVTKVKIISSVNFNFNDLLENEVFKNVHDIYLIVVDVIIIFALVMLLKNKIMGVFDK